MFSGKDKMFVLIRAPRGCLFMGRIFVNIDYVIALIVFKIQHRTNTQFLFKVRFLFLKVPVEIYSFHLGIVLG
jgi:hypothetical protein